MSSQKHFFLVKKLICPSSIFYRDLCTSKSVKPNIHFSYIFNGSSNQKISLASSSLNWWASCGFFRVGSERKSSFSKTEVKISLFNILLKLQFCTRSILYWNFVFSTDFFWVFSFVSGWLQPGFSSCSPIWLTFLFRESSPCLVICSPGDRLTSLTYRTLLSIFIFLFVDF